MAIKKHGKQYDLVVFGATGYTGKLGCEHIAKAFPTDLKWAVAGRSQTKLQDIVNESKRLNPDRALPAIEVVDSSNDESVTALVRKTYVLVTTVGPYCMYGEGVFRACAENGTHYVDCTGEFPWVSRMISRYEAKAKASGAIMLPQNGVESAPSDLSTWALAKHLREKLGAKTRQVTIVFHELKSSPSGGTLATALALFDYFTIAEVRDAGKPYALSPVPRSQSAYARSPESLWNKLVGARSLAPFGTVTTSIAAITDGSQVERTWGLLRSTPARRSEDYGPNFTWAQYMRVPGFLQGLAIHVGLGLGLLVLAFLPPVRGLLRRFVYQPGQGDDRDVANRDSLEYRGIAEPDDGGKSQSRAQCSIVWKGPTYLLTGVLITEAARTILEDDTELEGGVYTPACLGQGYIDRMVDAGLKLEVKTVAAE